MDTQLQPVTGAQAGEMKLPSGSIAVVSKFSGKHVLDVIERSQENKTGENSLDEEMQWQLIALTAQVDGRQLTVEAMKDLPGADFMFLMTEFGKSINYDAPQDNMPETPAPAGTYYKRLPNGDLATIDEFKGKHIMDAQRQMKRDGSDFFPVLISRMVKINDVDIFPEDIEAMDGLNVFALFGEVSAAMFPKS